MYTDNCSSNLTRCKCLRFVVLGPGNNNTYAFLTGSTGLLMTSPLAKQLPQQLLQQLPAWLLQLLSGEEWRSLMRLSIFPAGFSLRDAAHVLPSAGILSLLCCSCTTSWSSRLFVCKQHRKLCGFLGYFGCGMSCACTRTQLHVLQGCFWCVIILCMKL